MTSVLALPAAPRPSAFDLDGEVGHRAESELARASAGLLDPLPLLLAEPDVRTRNDPEAAAWYPAILSRLLAAEWPAQRRELLRAKLHELGFHSLVYGHYVRQGHGWLPQAFWTTYADMSWLQRYVCASYHQVDPRTAQALRSSLPCTWSIDALQRRCDENAALPSLEHAFVDDLRRTGMRSGALVTLPRRNTGVAGSAEQRHSISLASRHDGCAWLDEAKLGQVLTFSLCVDELYSKYLGLEVPAAPASDPLPPLTAMQRKILDCVARGLCDKKIASELQLSAYNVDYHLRQLRRRFGVHNRVQLARAAASASPA